MKFVILKSHSLTFPMNTPIL